MTATFSTQHQVVVDREARLERRTARYGRHSRLRGCSALTAATLAGGLFAAGAAWATPEGGTVVEGAAEIVQTSPTSIEIRQSTDVVIIEWQSFDIAEGESVTFIQPSDIAAALNRVLSGQTSAILGNLTANGQIVISNPNGIQFGKNAKVDVGAIIATSLGILNQNFLNGKMIFDQPGDPGAVVSNAGKITAKDGGLAALVAPGVENSGTITAKLGAVALAAGNAAVLDLYGDGLVQLAITAPVTQTPVGSDGQPVGALVSNSGGIYADGGTIVLTAEAAEGVLDRVVNMDGVLQAQTIEDSDGQIALVGGSHGEVQVAGTVDASGTDAGEKGGTVHVLAEKVKLADGASVDVSGDAGGGTVLVGGDKQGKSLDRTSKLAYKKNAGGGTTIVVSNDIEGDGSIDRAQVAYFDAGASADASAKTNGNGGKVVVWADQTMAFSGAITANGAGSGTGGFVETSGKSVTVAGTVAAAGGTWLIDPVGTVNVVTAIVNPNDILASTIVFTLDGGANFDIKADGVVFDVGLTTANTTSGTRLTFEDFDSTGGIDVNLNDKTLSFAGQGQGLDLIGNGKIYNGTITGPGAAAATAAGISLGTGTAVIQDLSISGFVSGVATNGTAASVTVGGANAADGNSISNMSGSGINVDAQLVHIQHNSVFDIGLAITHDVFGIRAEGADLTIEDNLISGVYTTNGLAFGIAAFGNGGFSSQVLVNRNEVYSVNASPAYLNLSDITDSTGAAFGILASSGGLVEVSSNRINIDDTGTVFDSDVIGGDLLAVGIAALGISGIDESKAAGFATAAISGPGLGTLLGLGDVIIADNQVVNIVSPAHQPQMNLVQYDEVAYEGGGVAIGILGLGGSVIINENEVDHVDGPVAAIGILGVGLDNSNSFFVEEEEDEDEACGSFFALCVHHNNVDNIYSDAAGAYIPVGGDGDADSDLEGFGGFAFGILTLGTTTEIALNIVGVDREDNEDTHDIDYFAGEGVHGSTLAAGIFGLGIGPIEFLGFVPEPPVVGGGGVTAFGTSSIEPFDDAVLAIRDNLVDGIRSWGNSLYPTITQTSSSSAFGSGLWEESLGIETLLAGGYAFGIVGASLWDVEIGTHYSDFQGVGFEGTEFAGGSVDSQWFGTGYGVGGTNLAIGITGISLGKRVVIDLGYDSPEGGGGNIAASTDGGIGDILGLLESIDLEKAPTHPDRAFTWIHGNYVDGIFSQPIAGLQAGQGVSAQQSGHGGYGGNAIGILGFSTRTTDITDNGVGVGVVFFADGKISFHKESGVGGTNFALGIGGIALSKSKEQEDDDDVDENNVITRVLTINNNIVSGVTSVPYLDCDCDMLQASSSDSSWGGIAIGIAGYSKGYAEINRNLVGVSVFDGEIEDTLDPIFGSWFSAGILGISDGRVRFHHDEDDENLPVTAGFGSHGGGTLFGEELFAVLSGLHAGGDAPTDQAVNGTALVIDGNLVRNIGYYREDIGDGFFVEHRSYKSIGIGGFAPSVAILNNHVQAIDATKYAFGILGAGTTDIFAAFEFFKNNPYVSWGDIGFEFDEELLYGCGEGSVVINGNTVVGVVAAPVQYGESPWNGDATALGIGGLGTWVNVSHNIVGRVSASSYDGGEPVHNQAGGILAVSLAGQHGGKDELNTLSSESWETDFTNPYVLAVGNTISPVDDDEHSVYAGVTSYGQDKSTAFGLLTYSPSAGVIGNFVSGVAAPGNWGALAGDGIVIIGSQNNQERLVSGEGDSSSAYGYGYGDFTWAFADSNISLSNTGNGMLVRELTLAYISRNVLGGIVANDGSVDVPVSDGSEGNGFGYGYSHYRKPGDGLRIEDVKKVKIFNNHINFNYGNGVNLVGGTWFLEMYENYIHQNHQNGILIGKNNHPFFTYPFTEPESETPTQELAALGSYGDLAFGKKASDLPSDLADVNFSFKINFNSIVGNGASGQPPSDSPELNALSSGSYGYDEYFAINNKAKGVVDARINWFGEDDAAFVASVLKRPLFLSEIGGPFEGYKQPNILFEDFLSSGFDGNGPIITGLNPFGFQPGAPALFDLFFDQADLLFPLWSLGRNPTGPGYAQFFTQNQGNIIGPFYVSNAGLFTHAIGQAGPQPADPFSPAAGQGGPGTSPDCVGAFLAGNTGACAGGGEEE